MGFGGYLVEMFKRLGYLLLGLILVGIGLGLALGTIQGGLNSIIGIIGTLIILIGIFTVLYPPTRKMKS